MNCEEEMREKNEMGEGGCMCVVVEKKKERHGIHGWWGKKWGVGYTCMMGKKGEWKKKEENKIEREKIK